MKKLILHDCLQVAGGSKTEDEHKNFKTKVEDTYYSLLGHIGDGLEHLSEKSQDASQHLDAKVEAHVNQESNAAISKS